MRYFLGIDGGQSHTTALIADSQGTILGRGTAGPSNHTREPGGRERLIEAVAQSFTEALQIAGLLKQGTPGQFRLASAHLAMTGRPQDKVEIIRHLLTADHLVVGHDAPGALAGALAGGEGVIVLAGTGSVACGETQLSKGARRFAQVGGHGFLFGDEGSAFAIAREALALALAAQDRGDQSGLKKSLLAHFKRRDLQTIAQDFYAGEISRDRLASFAARVDRLGERGDATASGLIDLAAKNLAGMALTVLENLGLARRSVKISYAGGVFRSRRALARFQAELSVDAPQAELVPARFEPEVGALLLAYRKAGKKITPLLLTRIEQTKSTQTALRQR